MSEQKIATFLMFTGNAEQAISFYVSLFPGAQIVSIERRPDGGVQKSEVALGGQIVKFFDSPVKHAFTFTPAMSLFVTCDSETEIDRLFAALSEGGGTLMGLGPYPFAKKFGWVNDRFGVSWQLILP